MSSLSSLPFTHDFVDSLPGDTSLQPGSRQVRQSVYSLVRPTPVKSPKLIAWSEDFAREFGLERPAMTGPDVDILGGNATRAGMKPYALCYGGHQFGNWAGQLGDGRAMTLFEAKDLKGRSWEFQLKGAGPTPYSRRADGRAVLRSSIREFVCSEAMHALGVPTTRALGLVATGDGVERDIFYDGHPQIEPGAIVCRVSPTFLRFGNFEIFASREETDELRKLVDYTIKTFFPELGIPGPDAYVEWFREISRRTAILMTEWMRVGFVHGVMNTDNMSILGLTIDYGPYGWLENYDPAWTPNTTDLPGRRYCYGRQPTIALWNLARLAEAIAVLIPDRLARLEEGLTVYEDTYRESFLATMSRKLGIVKLDGDDDIQLIVEMNELLQATDVDMTLFFRGLATWTSREIGVPAFLRHAIYGTQLSEDQATRWSTWFSKYASRLERDQSEVSERTKTMNAVNPLYVPRNYLLQQVIEQAEQGVYEPIEKLLEVLRDPYNEKPGREAFAAKRPDWARSKPGCSTLSCSS